MKVLTIDLDYALEPDINFYESHQCGNLSLQHLSAEQQWLLRMQQNQYKEEYARPNSENFLYMFDVFSKSLKHCKNVDFGYRHQNILHYLKDKKDIEILNIDHHHDIFSESLQRKLVESLNVVDVGSWVYYLHKNDQLKSYTWVGNENSGDFESGDPQRDNIISISKRYTKEQYTFPNYKFDYIHICFSPDYIPSQYWFVFNLFVNLYENQHGKAKIIENDFVEPFFKLDKTEV